MMPSSWRDDHAPEMLWAMLLTAAFPREHYLGCFREIASTAKPWFTKPESESEAANPEQANPSPKELDQPEGVLDHTRVSELSDEQFSALVDIPLRHPLGYAALRPLLLIESLPGLERWKQKLNVSATQADWQTLARAVINSLDHHSEQSTDVRWLKVIVPMISGRMIFHTKVSETAQNIFHFPNRGDMRSVRPSIRAMEMQFRRKPPSEWIGKYWQQLLESTGCVDPTSPDEYRNSERSRITAKNLISTRAAVINRFIDNLTPIRTDPRLDGAFGFVLYGLSLLEELATRELQQGVIARLVLRSLVETTITLRYLTKKDDPALWQAYRTYGAGQAKLAFLKAQETSGELPGFIDSDGLEAIANEDIWQEFVDIDLGQWNRSNLRDMAIECGAKDMYDKYYSWTSSFIHGQWGAVRDTNFLTCHNPLHRLHRIPRALHRDLESVEEDAIALMNEMIWTLDSVYPSSEALPLLILESEAT
jgi:hypothetical protein